MVEIVDKTTVSEICCAARFSSVSAEAWQGWTRRTPHSSFYPPSSVFRPPLHPPPLLGGYDLHGCEASNWSTTCSVTSPPTFSSSSLGRQCQGAYLHSFPSKTLSLSLSYHPLPLHSKLGLSILAARAWCFALVVACCDSIELVGDWNTYGLHLIMALPWWMKLDWRQPKVLLILCAIEFPFTVAALTIFGLADPNTYRTDLWSEGAKHGWNSHPIAILYSYANYRPAAIPIPWAQL